MHSSGRSAWRPGRRLDGKGGFVPSAAPRPSDGRRGRECAPVQRIRAAAWISDRLHDRRKRIVRGGTARDRERRRFSEVLGLRSENPRGLMKDVVARRGWWAPARSGGVLRGLLGPLVFAGVTLVPAAGSSAPAAPAPAATPSGPAVLVDRIAAVVGDEIVPESEVQKLVAVRFLEHKPGETDAEYRDRVLDERIVDLLRERQLRR